MYSKTLEMLRKMDKKKLIKNFNEYSKNLEWFIKNKSTIISRYEGQWVVVKNQKVVDYDNSYDHLLSRIDSKYSSNQLRQILIEYAEDRNLLLLKTKR